MPGVLYLVATPIGNLEDITYRAVRVLGEVDLVACEDTRETRKLLDRYGIRQPTISYHEHNEAERAAELAARMLAGEKVALVSDAAVTALAASGLPTDVFRFGGFLPPKTGQRERLLQALENEPATLIFYEAPHRILEALETIQSVLGPRPVVVARELTKLHEEILRGAAAEIHAVLAARAAIKGEMTLLIGKATGPKAEQGPVKDAVEELMRAGTERMQAIKQVARRRGLSKREVYEQLLDER
jgi:16S rRNA (cytidine1402-2'-O)-methyltransferase